MFYFFHCHCQTGFYDERKQARPLWAFAMCSSNALSANNQGLLLWPLKSYHRTTYMYTLPPSSCKNSDSITELRSRGGCSAIIDYRWYNLKDGNTMHWLHSKVATISPEVDWHCIWTKNVRNHFNKSTVLNYEEKESVQMCADLCHL